MSKGNLVGGRVGRVSEEMITRWQCGDSWRAWATLDTDIVFSMVQIITTARQPRLQQAETPDRDGLINLSGRPTIRNHACTSQFGRNSKFSNLDEIALANPKPDRKF